jgi:hypothetical protein
MVIENVHISVSSSKNRYTVAASLYSRLVILNTRSFVTLRMTHPTWYFTEPIHAQHCMRKWCQKVSTDVGWSRDGIANGKRRAKLSLMARQCVCSTRSALVRKFSLCYVSCRSFTLHFFLFCFVSFNAVLIVLLIFLIFLLLVFYFPIFSFSVHSSLASPFLFCHLPFTI